MLPLIIHTRFQPNIPSRSGDNDEFISFAIFSNDGHLEISTRLNFTILKPWILIILHMNFKDSGMLWFKRISHLNGPVNGLKCQG